jgi:hypothetical protein
MLAALATAIGFLLMLPLLKQNKPVPNEPADDPTDDPTTNASTTD